MKVLHTIPYFNKASGGPTSCTYNLLKGLNDVGTQTTLLTFRPDEGDVVSEDIFIHYLTDDRKTPLWFSNNFAKSLEKEILQNDIIHINTIWTWPSHNASQIAKKYKKPIVLSPHGMLYPQALKVSAWKKKLIAPFFVNKDLNSASCIHATSEEEARHIRDYGVTIPIAIIPNCICMNDFPSQRNVPNKVRKFGFVGRLNPIKNIDLLIEAWIKLDEKTSGAELIIIGDGEPEYVDYLKKIAVQRKLNNILFHGFLSGVELKSAIANLDFHILPSKSENFGMVVAEALACGVPSITSKGTPWESLVINNAGWWIEADVNTIAYTLSQCLNIDESLRLSMGKNGYNFVNREFSSISIGNKMTSLYGWLLGYESKPDFVI